MSSHPLFHRKLIEWHNASSGITRISPTMVIYQGKSGFRGQLETSLELEFISYQNCLMARMRTIKRKGTSLDSRDTSWTLHDPDKPAELLEILDIILAAAEPGAPVIDQQGWFARWLNRLTRHRQLNERPALAEQTEPFHQVLSASILESADGIWVSLEFDRGRHAGKQYQNLPIEALKALQTHLQNLEPSA